MNHNIDNESDHSVQEDAFADLPPSRAKAAKRGLPSEYILDIILEGTRPAHWTHHVQMEYETAVRDLVADNFFHLCKNIEGGKIHGPIKERGPYTLYLKIADDNKLLLDIRRMKQEEDGSSQEYKREEVNVPITPFRKVIKDYFFMCESYFEAVDAQLTPHKIETVDMARRGVHNEGAEQLQDWLMPTIDVDMATARRLFTLICVLHIR